MGQTSLSYPIPPPWTSVLFWLHTKSADFFG